MSEIPPPSHFLIYEDEDGALQLDVRFEGATVWLTQPAIAELFCTMVPNVGMHLKNIFEEGELAPVATLQNFLTVRQDGSRQVTRNLEHYNLDAKRGVMARPWRRRGSLKETQSGPSHRLRKSARQAGSKSDRLLRQRPRFLTTPPIPAPTGRLNQNGGVA